MSNGLDDTNARMIQERLSENDARFLKSIKAKKETINNEIKEVEDKNKKIDKKILRDKKHIKKRTRENRKYIENTEAVKKSVEVVLNNLNTLKTYYENIEDNLLKIVHKSKSNLTLEDTRPEIDALVQKINDTELLKQKTKEDNEKNYIIIDNFLNGTMNEESTLEEYSEFYNLTLENLQDNPVLKICERRVELPYSKKEIEDYMREYPDEYKTVQDVIAKEFMVNISLYNRHPILSRLKEAYYLCRTKEMMPILESFNYAKDLMFKANLNPYIIAAVKSRKQLEDYIKCLDENNLENYSHFKIVYEINPLTV